MLERLVDHRLYGAELRRRGPNPSKSGIDTGFIRYMSLAYRTPMRQKNPDGVYCRSWNPLPSKRAK
jgi:hypothetical protein